MPNFEALRDYRPRELPGGNSVDDVEHDRSRYRGESPEQAPAVDRVQQNAKHREHQLLLELIVPLNVGDASGRR